MGADIYLDSKYEAQRAVWEPRFTAAVEARNAKYPRGVTMPDDCPEQAAVEEAYEAMQSQGYFRDSYNATSLFWVLGLSWWGSGFIRKDGRMGLRGMKKLRAFLAGPEGQLTEVRMKAWRAGQGERAVITDEGSDSLASWREMFENKRVRLIALLDEAIALNEPLNCSV